MMEMLMGAVANSSQAREVQKKVLGGVWVGVGEVRYILDVL